MSVGSRGVTFLEICMGRSHALTAARDADGYAENPRGYQELWACFEL